MVPKSPLLVGVELGGTKCICVIGTGPGDIYEQVRLPTDDPGSTLAAIGSVLDGWTTRFGEPDGIGVASFGPLELREESAKFGCVTSSAKTGWRGVNVLSRVAAGRRCALGFNTDVNAAALAEGRWGAAQALSDFAYVTVGTGVGVGVVANGSLLGGCNHPELGHIRVGRMAGDSWPGCCTFHGDCVEGLASGPAISARAGRPADEVEADSPIWIPVADALGRLLHALVFTTMPRRILIGGGVASARPELLVLVRQRLLASINNYIDIEDLVGSVDQFVVAAGLGESAGPLGALALAADAASRALRELPGSV